jgi:hypothetical protein
VAHGTEIASSLPLLETLGEKNASRIYIIKKILIKLIWLVYFYISVKDVVWKKLS